MIAAVWLMRDWMAFVRIYVYMFNVVASSAWIGFIDMRNMKILSRASKDGDEVGWRGEAHRTIIPDRHQRLDQELPGLKHSPVYIS